jgi:hypothetical protein
MVFPGQSFLLQTAWPMLRNALDRKKAPQLMKDFREKALARLALSQIPAYETRPSRECKKSNQKNPAQGSQSAPEEIG